MVLRAGGFCDIMVGINNLRRKNASDSHAT